MDRVAKFPQLHSQNIHTIDGICFSSVFHLKVIDNGQLGIWLVYCSILQISDSILRTVGSLLNSHLL